MRNEKKYEILPGVELPDFKTIKEAASDFSISDVGEVDVRQQPVFVPGSEASQTSSVSPEELARLKSLGDKVAEDEARAQAESRKKMDSIMSKAVHASESLSDLKASNIGRVSDEKRKALEESMKAEAESQAEEDAKNKAREERRKLQQRLYEEAKERAEKEKAEEASKKADEPVAETSGEAPAEPAAPAPAEEKITAPAAVNPEKFVEDAKKTAKIASAEETFDDFKEFLEDNDDE